MAYLRIPNRNTSTLVFETLLAMAAAATVALIYGLAAELSWQMSLMIIVIASVLFGGVFFSIQSMRTAGRKFNGSPEDKQNRPPGTGTSRS